MRRSLIAVLMCLVVVPTFAQSKHPFTFEDMMKLKRVGEPEVSPDGKWVTFSAVDVDLAANTKIPHIWIVPTVGGKEREIIADQDADRPRWAPDGKRFAFVSTKEGGSQVWIADFDGTSGAVKGVTKLTSIATEAGGELWSPDGKNILFTSDVYPECADEDCNARKLQATETSKVKALIFDRLLYRHWNAYKDGKRSHLFLIPVPPVIAPAAQPNTIEVSTGAVTYTIPLDLTPGDYDAPVFSVGGQDNYAFSPDGQEVCYTSNHDKVEATSTNNDLWLVPVTGGPAKNITADNPASDSTPLYSPDGKYIAYRAQTRPGYESDRFRLMLYDRATGEKKNFTEPFDRWVDTVAWAPDSSTIYFTADNEGAAGIYDLKLGRPWPREIVSGVNDDLTLTSDGKFILFTRMSVLAPNEIYRAATEFEACEIEVMSGDRRRYDAMDCELSKPQPLTHMNDAVLSKVDLSRLDKFWFKGASGENVQAFMVKPPNFDPDKKYPLKYIVHGGPEVPEGDLWSYRWNPELFAANGYVVIFINFHGSPGYGQKFIDAINGDWGGAPYEDLMKGLDYAEQHYTFIDKNRECALGASFGGYMINWILGHTDRFKCLVSHDGTFNTESQWGTTEELWFNNWEFKGPPYDNRELYQKWSPHMFAKNFKTPTLVVHSQRDYRLDVSEGLQLFTTLQMEGIPSKMLYFPDEGHWVLKPQNGQLWYKTVNDWVDHWVGK
jgi:dipeptidyl aminopeptidase/acylaminoacyl peptidase